MPGNSGLGPNRQSGSYLASVIVVFFGSVSVALIAGALGGDPFRVMLILAGIVAVLLVLLLLSRSIFVSSGERRFGWMRRRKARPDDNYTPERARQRSRYGTNAPPSAKELREMKGGLNNWVPAQSKEGSKRPPRKR